MSHVRSLFFFQYPLVATLRETLLQHESEPPHQFVIIFYASTYTLNLSLGRIKKYKMYLRTPYCKLSVNGKCIMSLGLFKCCTERSLFYDLHGIYLIQTFMSVKCSADYRIETNFPISRTFSSSGDFFYELK